MCKAAPFHSHFHEFLVLIEDLGNPALLLCILGSLSFYYLLIIILFFRYVFLGAISSFSILAVSCCTAFVRILIIAPKSLPGAPGLVLPLGCFDTLVEHLFNPVLFARWSAPQTACREW